ncbi:MAG: C69 family dipeptidase [Gemmatimonadota bacterium]|nr:MAG: C69 family dipeptidase [Gemmatimonadota bacterium]
MKRIILRIALANSLLLFSLASPGISCTNFLITKGASVDGSTMISYSADSHVLYGDLYYMPAGNHRAGAMLDIYDWDTGDYHGQIKQVGRTYAVVGLINEHQVAIGETTWGGREELVDSTGIMDYGSLMYVALHRAKTAREAIRIMGDLVAEYGYNSSGESFSIADPEEVWFMDLIGKGPGNTGAVWVARKIPDGYISAHANQARIRRFPLNDKENCLYAEDVISFAREKGYFSGEDEEFSFADAYAPLDFGALRFCEARVWSMFRQAAPSLNLSTDYVNGVEGAEPFPLWIKPDTKLSLQDVMGFMRDHFEDSEFDLTFGIGAGPYCLPYRWRPLTWKVDDVTYCNERATSTQQTGFSFVTQSRSWLPDPIGGIIWFGVDDTYSTVYIPMYCGINEVPRSYAVGTATFDAFSWDSAFWIFNFVANFAYLRYCDMIVDIQKVQREFEDSFVAHQPEIEKAALALYEQAPRLARDYLTEYSVKQGEAVVKRWKRLGELLIWKYMDGNVKDEHGGVTHPGYDESWYRRIVEESGEQFKVRKIGEEETH